MAPIEMMCLPAFAPAVYKSEEHGPEDYEREINRSNH